MERYKVVATFDKDTCDLCGALDGKVFTLSEYQVGLTAPPFHPWCRCCTCPWFEDMKKVGERWYRAPDGTTGKAPADMSFDKWKGKYVKESGLTHGSARSTLNSGKLSNHKGAAMRAVGKLDRNLYSCVTSDIASDDVIITSERIQHIKKRRGADFLDKYERYFPLVLSDPDYIFPDDRINTAIVCKVIGDKGDAINLVLRLAVTGDNPAYKNSILTAIRENKKRFSQRLRNNKPIYKKD